MGKPMTVKDLVWNGIKTFYVCIYEHEIYEDGDSLGVLYTGYIENLKFKMIYKTIDLNLDEYDLEWYQENSSGTLTDVYIRKKVNVV